MTRRGSDFDIPFWAPPDWVSEGDTVWLAKGHDYESGKTRVVKCTVAVAAGNHARVVNSERGIDRWASLNGALLVPPTDERHPNRRLEREMAAHGL